MEWPAQSNETHMVRITLPAHQIWHRPLHLSRESNGKPKRRQRKEQGLEDMGDLFAWIFSFFILIALLVLVVYQVLRFLNPRLHFNFFSFNSHSNLVFFFQLYLTGLKKKNAMMGLKKKNTGGYKLFLYFVSHCSFHDLTRVLIFI